MIERNMTAKIIVMRYPVLMEDEGHHILAKTFDTRKDAEAWVQAQKGEYFSPSDYYILEKDAIQRR
jgi:hypothetical protein